MSLFLESEEFLLEFPSPRHLSSCDSYPFDLSGLGDPSSSSNATASLAVGVIGTHKPLHHSKGETPLGGLFPYVKVL